MVKYLTFYFINIILLTYYGYEKKLFNGPLFIVSCWTYRLIPKPAFNQGASFIKGYEVKEQ
jgi:hypothetical protein